MISIAYHFDQSVTTNKKYSLCDNDSISTKLLLLFLRRALIVYDWDNFCPLAYNVNEKWNEKSR